MKSLFPLFVGQKVNKCDWRLCATLKSLQQISHLGPTKNQRTPGSKVDCPLLTEGHKHNGMKDLSAIISTGFFGWVTPSFLFLSDAVVSESIIGKALSV